jgi:hypothetical protein
VGGRGGRGGGDEGDGEEAHCASIDSHR